MWCIVADMQQASSSAEVKSNSTGRGNGSASPRLGRSSSLGMGSGESQSSGRGPTWSQMPRSHGSRVTARIPSWLHLPSLGQSAIYNIYTLQHDICIIYHAAGTLIVAVGECTQNHLVVLPSISIPMWFSGKS